jgi:hypothetical protein
MAPVSEPPPRHDMVAWLSPRTLLSSAREAVVSALFARYADKREIEGGLSAECFCWRPPSGEPAWLDYASDVGDGWAPTYCIARLMAEPELAVAGELTRRGRVLVLGGDEVYPSASKQAYDERFEGPYALALPEDPAVAEEDRPRLFALPGNHDWYDGLTSFMRFFTQGASVGGWKTAQKRSYFAVEIADGWWVWGIDIQFDTYIDAPQMEYFTAAAKRLDGGRVILATAKPSWIDVGPTNPRPQSWQSIAFLKERVIEASGGTLALTLTGDLHHYSRYSPPGDGRDSKITAGGGGAYLSATHWLPRERRLPPVVGGPDVLNTLQCHWPEAGVSRKLGRGVGAYLLPWVTPSLNVVLMAVGGLLALLLAAGLKDQAGDLAGSLDRGGGELLLDALTPWFVLASGLLAFGLGAWARSGGAPRWFGLLHAAAQIAAASALTLAVLSWGELEWLADDGFWLGYATVGIVALLSAVSARWIFTLYLYLAQRLEDHWHAEEAFAAQSRTIGVDYKHFLRFRIEGDHLKMWVIGVASVPRAWTRDARPEPVGREPEIELVDQLSFSVPRR